MSGIQNFQSDSKFGISTSKCTRFRPWRGNPRHQVQNRSAYYIHSLFLLILARVLCFATFASGGMGVGATPCVSKLSVLAIREKNQQIALHFFGGPKTPISNHLNLNQKLDLNLIWSGSNLKINIMLSVVSWYFKHFSSSKLPNRYEKYTYVWGHLYHLQQAVVLCLRS